MQLIMRKWNINYNYVLTIFCERFHTIDCNSTKTFRKKQWQFWVKIIYFVNVHRKIVKAWLSIIIYLLFIYCTFKKSVSFKKKKSFKNESVFCENYPCRLSDFLEVLVFQNFDNLSNLQLNQLHNCLICKSRKNFYEEHTGVYFDAFFEKDPHLNAAGL